MTDPLPSDELARRWARTLGQQADWDRVDPAVTQKPVEVGGTLSQLATVGHTLSGGATLGGATLSGGATVGGSTLGGGATIPGGGGGVPSSTRAGYELIGEVGRGGMGVVYRARQRSLARDIALKFVRPEQANAGARERFVSEALVNGLLDHPNIVPVHDLGTTEQGEVYLAMKLVGGRSWKTLLHPQEADERAAAAAYDLDKHLAVLTGVGNAVAFAHARGIVHRDLKPENVMVGEFGEVLVMDWGIAVDIRDAPDGDQRAQHKSTVTAPSGTPSYMAPELAEGRGRDIGPWTDVYLLGAILHELLTGHAPHRGRTLMEVLVAASRSEPPRFGPEVPAGLGAVAAKAMSRASGDRHASVAEFQAAIARWLESRDSEKIAQGARERLAAAEGMASADAQARNRRYAAFAEAVAGFRQALVLWGGNAAARDGERAARIAYAQAALSGGDLGLAEAQLEPLAGDASARGVVEQVATARRAAAARERAAARNRWLLGGATVAIVAGLGIGFVLVDRQRTRAVAAEGEARTAAVKAQAAETEARAQERTAVAERDKARAAEAAAEAAKRDISRRFALNAAAESRHADAARDTGAAALWLAEALARDVAGGPSERGWRQALGARLLGLATPIAAGGTVTISDGGPHEEMAMRMDVLAAAGTGTRDLVVALVTVAPDVAGGIATEAMGTYLATWKPGEEAIATAGVALQGFGGWVVGPRAERIVLHSPGRGWILARRAGTAFTVAEMPPADADAPEPLEDSLAFSPDGRWLAGVDTAPSFRVWSGEDAKPRLSEPLPVEHGARIAFSADGAWCLVHTATEPTRIYDTATWTRAALPSTLTAADHIVGLPGGRRAVLVAGAARLVERDGTAWHIVRELDGELGRAFRALGMDARVRVAGDRIEIDAERQAWTIAVRGTGATAEPVTATPRDPMPSRTELTEGISRLAGWDGRGSPRATIDEAAGLALAWSPNGIVAADLARPVVAPPAPAPTGASDGTTRRLPTLAYGVGGFAVTDGTGAERVVPFADAHHGRPAALLAGSIAIATDDGVAWHALAGGAPTTVPYPDRVGLAPGGRVVASPGGKRLALFRDERDAEGAATSIWTWVIDPERPAAPRGPWRLPDATTWSEAAPADDGTALLTPDGSVAALDAAAGATLAPRPWRAGDPVPVMVGDTPVRVTPPLERGGSVFARDRATGRMRELRIRPFDRGAVTDMHIGVIEYRGTEAVGEAVDLGATRVLSVHGGTEVSVDLSPDAQRVVTLDAEGQRVLVHDAAGSPLVDVAIADLVGASARELGTVDRVGWAGDDRLLLQGLTGSGDRTARTALVVTLPHAADEPRELGRRLGALVLRRVTAHGEVEALHGSELVDAARAWAPPSK